MATTGELRTIIQELELIDIGDAASYLGEEATVAEESSISVPLVFVPVTETDLLVSGDSTVRSYVTCR